MAKSVKKHIDNDNDNDNKGFVKIKKIKSNPKPKFITEDEGKAFDLIMDNDLVFLQGLAASGKTYTAIITGLYLLLDKKFDTLILTKPAVATEQMGFLPGGINEKYHDYIKHIERIIASKIGLGLLDKYILENKIQMMPLAFIKGDTWDKSFIVIDEAENCTKKLLFSAISRLGKESKMVITGDEDQRDIRNPGLKYWENALKDCPCVESIQMAGSELLRHPIVNYAAKVWNKEPDKEG